MIPSSAGRRYAEAAFQVAQSDRAVERWLNDLRIAADGVAGNSATLFFKDPKVTREEKLATLQQLFPSVQPHVMNLLRMLAVRDRLHLMPAIYREFQSLERDARGIVTAEVTVARPFDDGERAEIGRRLAQATGKQVEVRLHVNPSILGGIVVRIGDQLIDASVAGRLERLRHEMAV